MPVLPHTILRRPRLASRLVLAGLLTALAGPGLAQDVTLDAPGASEDLIARLEGNALLFREPEEGTTLTGADIIASARADYGRLIGILYEEGYFAPQITIRLDGQDAARISPFSAPATVNRVQIDIETGPVFRLGQAEIGPLAPGTEVPETFRTGETATTPLLRATTNAALDAWRNEGRATAEVADQSITARNRDALLDVSISVDPGPVITFGNLLPEGHERMRVSRIIEIAGLPTGEVYSPAALTRAQERLRDTGVFSAVSLELADPGPGDVADVRLLVDESPLRRLGFGAEVSTDEGAAFSAFWIHRNLFGGAERLRLDAGVSGIGQSDNSPDLRFAARYERPATFTPDTTFRLDFEASLLDEPTFQQDSIVFEVGLDHILTERWTVRGGLSFSYSDISDNLGQRTIFTVALPLGATFENRDDPLDARAGTFADLTLTPFLPIGDDPGLRSTFDGRAYRGFGEDRALRVAGRLQLGTIFGSDIDSIPPDSLFFSGGSGTVRGQAFQSLGAIQNGVESGGRGFVGLSGEVRYDIGDTNFGAVGFLDTGFVSTNALGETGPSEFHAGAGLGLRYATPFGPIRVDLGVPVSGDDSGQQLFLYIGIGQAF